MSDSQTLKQPAEVQTTSARSRGTGRRLTQREVALILQMSELGKNCVEIAQAVDCNPSTVTRTLEQWQDQRPIARKYLEANAPKLARTIVKSKDAATALKTLGKLDVVREDQVTGGNQMVVVLGSQAQQLEPPTVIAALSPSHINNLESENHS